jgi:glycosyltransferase involved in cell wall biosynthesis
VTRVQVLLSTYNGHRYLPELLDSIARQTGVQVEVLARDDGSTDGTWELLREIRNGLPITACRGDRLGPVGSFFWLLEHASPEADFLALADQDDVWLPRKLARAVERLAVQVPDRPAMYCSRLTLVDEQLGFLGSSPPAPKGPSFENSLAQNIAAGCTMVLNQAARAALDRGYPARAFMHDWWIYQVVTGLGVVVHDAESHILYRQHAGNVVGADHPGLRRLTTRIRGARQRGFRTFSDAQLRELQRIHGGCLSPDHQALLQHHLDARRSVSRRLGLAFDRELVLQAWWQEVLFRCLVLLNRM